MADLYKQKGKPEVYVKKDGKLQHIADPETFEQAGYKWEDITELPGVAFEKLKGNIGVGSPLTAEELQQGVQPEQVAETEDFDEGTSSSKALATATSTQDMINALQKQFEGTQEDIQEAQEETKPFLKKIKDLMTGVDISDMRTEAQEAAGLPEATAAQQGLVTEIGTLNEQLVSIKAEEQAEIDREENRLTSMAEIETATNRIKDKYNRKKNELSGLINAKAAELTAQQGLVNQARQIANQAVDDYTWELEQEVKGLQFFYEENQDYIDDLSTDLQNEFNTLLQIKQNQLQEEKATKQWIAEQKINNPNADISLDMSLEEVAEELASSAQPMIDTSRIKTYTDENGMVTAVDIATGETLWKQKVGKARDTGGEDDEDDELPELTNANLNRLTAAGVPPNVANSIHNGYAMNFSTKEIAEEMIEQGRTKEEATEFLSAYQQVMGPKEGGLSGIPSMSYSQIKGIVDTVGTQNQEEEEGSAWFNRLGQSFSKEFQKVEKGVSKWLQRK